MISPQDSTPARATPHSRAWFWPALVTVLATVPVAGVFTVSRLFYVRDLTLAFRSRYLWLRDTVLAGQWPWWDPYAANGQSAAADALYQIFHPITLAIRLALPAIVGFNVWVALPVPLAAYGAWRYLRRQVSAPAAAIGAIAFGISGPIVSSTNFPNLSWSLAAIPYVFWALDDVWERPRAAGVAWLASAVALQSLAGEPVTLAATLATAAAYTAFLALPTLDRNRRLLGVASGVAAGLLLAAIQFLPLLKASRRSVRSLMPGDDFWSLHPLALVELVMPHFFGDYFHSFLRELPWMIALNSQRDPFYYTMYIGVPVVLVSAVAICSGRRVPKFWAWVALAMVVAAVGAHTPLYPALQKLVPPVKSFRFPVKYLSLAVFATAILAAHGWQMVLDGAVDRRMLRRVLIPAGTVAAGAYLLVLWLLVAPRIPTYGFFRLAEAVHVHAPVQGAQYLLLRARPLLTTMFLEVVCAGFLLAVAASARRERRFARVALGVLLCADLVAANSGVNPTIAEPLVHRPVWLDAVARHPEARVYVGGRLNGVIDTLDPDAPKWASLDDSVTVLEQRYVASNQLVYAPSGWRLREGISYDLPLLWPVEYARMLSRFKVATRAERLRYLRNAGIRYCVLPDPPFPGAAPLGQLVSLEQMHVYECNPGVTRAYVVPDALMGPDVGWQIEGLFQERFNPSAGVLVSETPPPASGTPGTPVKPAARIVEEHANRVVVRAGLPGDGYLALLDSYDPGWRVEVDGGPASLMRANGLFRAVHLTRGTHTVTFTYRPRALYAGAVISAVTAVGLVVLCLVDRRRSLFGPRPVSSERYAVT